MANFTPLSAAIGGALIGLASALLMLLDRPHRRHQRYSCRPVWAGIVLTAPGELPSSPG